VEPLVDFGHLEYVLILTGNTPAGE
jgi:hypothetical protein